MIARQTLTSLSGAALACAVTFYVCPNDVRAEDADYVVPVPMFLQASNRSGLREAPTGPGVFMSPFGATLAFCSVNGCYSGPHLAAQVLVNMTTQIDATAQEIGLFVNATSKTGKSERWAPQTFYLKGSQVQLPDGALYEALNAGRSGTTSAPQGAGADILDGGIKWAFKSNAVHDGKTALGAGLNMIRGSGQGWALVSDLTVQNGVGNENAFGYENDCTNYNKDSDFGVPFLMTCFFQGGQGKGTFPMFAYRYVATGDGSSYGAHFGDFFNGSVTIKDATIADATDALNTIRVMAGSKHQSVFVDRSSSVRSLDIGGDYKTAIDISEAKVQEAQIKGHGWSVAPDGTISAAGFRSVMRPPHDSFDSCSPGDISFGDSFIYVCVKQNSWKRATLDAW